MAPGEAGRLGLTLRNTSDLVHHLQLEVRGLPAGARALSEPPTVKLLPGATAQCSLTVELAATPPADAGEHVLGVLARSPHAREVSRCEEVRLDVPALPDLVLSVEPELVRAGGRGRFTATLVNEGNTALTVALAGSDPERRVRFSATPPSVVLRPRQTSQAVVTAAVPRPWTGQESRRPLTVTAEAGQVRAASTVTLLQAPRLPPVLLRSLAGVVALLLLAGTLVLVEQLTSDEVDPSAAQETPGTPSDESSGAPTPTPTPTPTPSASPTALPPPTDGASSPTSAEPSATPTSEASPTGLSTPLETVQLTDGQSAPPVRPAGPRVTRLGFDVVPAVEGAPTGCEGAQLAVHEAAEADQLTVADPGDSSRCQDAPLTITFLEPVSDVTLGVVADGDYLLSLEAEDGSTRQAPGQARDEVLTATAGERLRAVTLAADRDGRPPARIGLVQVTYRPPSP